MPTLIVVSGPMGSGKTTLAHKIRPSFGQILSFVNAVG